MTALGACGGRTLDDGSYDVYDQPHGAAGSGAEGGVIASSGAPAIAGSAPSSGGSPSTGDDGNLPPPGARGFNAGPVAGCGVPPRANGSLTLIDNMESHQGFIDQYEGRRGAWYTFNDGTPGTQSPSTGINAVFPMQLVSDDPTGGRYTAYVAGQRFTDWGVGIGAELNEGCPYDASVYTGLRFYARSSTSNELTVRMPSTTAYTGFGCPSATGCSDVFRTTITLSPEWKEYYIAFASLAPSNDVPKGGVNAAALLRLEFVTPGLHVFDFSLDALTFY